MLLLNKQLRYNKTDHEKTALQRQIDATDKQINELVFELYGMTEAERKIIEDKTIQETSRPITTEEGNKIGRR